MEKKFLVFTLFLSLLFAFCACSEEEKVPDSISLDTLCRIFKGEELRIYLNGEEYSFESEEAGFLLISIKEDADAALQEGKLQLVLLPIFPDEINDLLRIEVDAVSTFEKIELKGRYQNSIWYTIDVEGYYQEGVLNLYLTYETGVDYMVGTTQLIDFVPEALDFNFLHPRVPEVEYKGEKIPVKEFVRDALSPFLSSVNEYLGGTLQITFLPGGSTEVGVRKHGSGEYLPVPGKHGFHFVGSNLVYLFTDVEGAVWMHNAFLASDEMFDWVSPLYYWRMRDVFFCSLFYSFAHTAEEPGKEFLMLAFDTLNMSDRRILDAWLEHAKYTLDQESIEKFQMLLSMLYDDTLDLICIKAREQEK